MSTICLSAAKTTKMQASCYVKGKILVSHCATTNIRGLSKLTTKNSIDVRRSSKLIATSKSKAFSNVSMNLRELNQSVDSNIKSNLIVSGNAVGKLVGSLRIQNLKAAKFTCDILDVDSINNFSATEKLYPNKDLIINKNNSYFINRGLNTTNLYDSINEGIFLGNYTKHGASGYIVSNDQDYIQPSSIFTKGSFRYKCQVSTPTSDIKDSILSIRASAPLSDKFSNIPPQYKISNIKLEDPSGNLIAQYRDFTIRGDGQFATYLSMPTINNGKKNQWEENYPVFASISGYTLNLDFDIDCLDDPFSGGFSAGYEEKCDPKFVYVSGNNNDYLAQDGSPFSTQSQGFTLNPNTSIKISSIEISCSGNGYGLQRSNFLPFYSDVREIGNRQTRKIYPLDIVKSTENINVFPNVNSTWKTVFAETNNHIYNASGDGVAYLISKMQNTLLSNFITLDSNTSLSDSGRLTLKFAHQPPNSVISYSEGAFSFGAPSRDFNTASLVEVAETDNFFTIDSIELKVLAKKASGSNNYFLDVVGYSDDGLLNITSRKNAFLQNDDSLSSHQLTNIPSVSGLNRIDDLGISSTAISNKNQYFESLEITNPAGDHYVITDTPVVNSTTFKEYTVPLKIYPDAVSLGNSIDYSMSSFFENLYLDIYPIPSGASISTAYLVITYKPSNALALHVVGQQQDIELTQRNVILKPSSSANTKLISNSGTSVITNIPQAYSSDVGSHSNYTKRWRGIDGNVVWGPFDPNMFSSDFYNPPANHPFTYGYYKFNENVLATSSAILVGFPILIRSETLPHYASSSGLLDLYSYGSPSNKTPTRSDGFRFQSNSLFSISTGNRTIDWSRISQSNQILANKITDSFEAFIKTPNASLTTSPVNSGLFFNYKDGFAIYMRFSPAENVIGSNYDLFSSGLLFSIVANNTYPLSVGYSGGRLTVVAKDQNQNTILAQDSINYDSYAYPLPLLITYNDNNSRKLKIYTDNELDDNFTVLRATSSSFNINIQPSSIVDFSPPIGDITFGPRISKFITEVGLSDSDRYGANIVENNPNKLYKQTTANSFFDGLRSQNNNRYKLFDFVNDDVDAWKLGEYNYGHFSADFSRMTKRGDSKYIVHKLNYGTRLINSSAFSSEAFPYSSFTNITLPQYINLSGICYHSQIENDSLRFSLSDVDENFVAVAPRINKNLPRGYNFREDSLAIETILEHETFDNILWPDGKVGPKLIVSLYTTAKDDIDRPSTKNLGLINRAIHYIKPSGNIHKISSTFNYQDLLNRSEPWADFPYENIISEFDHHLFNYDVNNMFLQYDLAYPSGEKLNSTIKIYSANVKLDKAFYKKKSIDDNLALVSSGDKSVVNTLNLFTTSLGAIYAGCNLYVDGSPTPSDSKILPLFTQSSYFENTNLNIFTLNVGRVNTFISTNFGDSGAVDEYNIPPMPLYIGGRFPQFDDQILPLYVKIMESYPSTTENISLFTHNKVAETLLNSVNIFVRGNNSIENRYPSVSMNCFVNGLPFPKEVENSFNLYVNSIGQYETYESSFNLFTINYPAINQQVDQQGVIIWDSNNVGKSITSLDNSQAFLDANDEIRGVDLICYGACNDE